MAVMCAKCYAPIAGKGQIRDQKQVRNERGQITATYHKKCFLVVKKMTRPSEQAKPAIPTAYDMAQGRGRKNQDDLTPEEVEALRERQRQIAEQRELEERPEHWADAREPVTLDIEEMSDPDRIVGSPVTQDVAESRPPE